MLGSVFAGLASTVAPLAGSVDRNIRGECQISMLLVAPLAGSVDRNHFPALPVIEVTVAPLAGSVDRNLHFSRPDKGPLVAPLAGSVDRNTAFALPASGLGESLPSRGAWIEISARRSFSSRTHCRSPRGERG